LNVTVAIKDINQPIEETIDAGVQVNQRPFVVLKASGSVAAVQNNLVDVSKLSGTQTIELSQGDLSAISDTLKAMGLGLDVTGSLNGKITATINGLNNISAEGDVALAGTSVGGKQLSGDRIAYQQIHVGLKAAVGQRIVADVPITLQPSGSGAPDQIAVHADIGQDSVSGLGAALASIAQQLGGSNKAPAATIPGSGQITITAYWNVAGLVSQAPHLFQLQQGTTLTSGDLRHETTVTVADGKAVIATATSLKNFAGTSGGTPLKLDNVDADAGVTAVGGDHPQLADINVKLDSDFAKITGGGADLTKTTIQGSSDLATIQQKYGQLFNFDSMFGAPAGKHVSLAGAIGFNAFSNGDVTGGGNFALGGNFSLTNLNIAVPGGPAPTAASILPLTSSQIGAKFELDRAAQGSTVSASANVASLTVGQALKNEAINATASANLAPDLSSASNLNVNVDTSFARKITVTSNQIVLKTAQGSQTIDLDVEELNLAKIDAIANLLFNQAAAPVAGETTVVVVPPPTVMNGTSTVKANVSQSGGTTTVNVSSAVVHGLVIKNGANVCTWPHDITASLAANVGASQASVTALNLDTGIGTTVGLASNSPITATGLNDPANMAVKGGVTIDGEIEPAARIAEVFEGAAVNSYPYQGHLHVDENLAKDPSGSRLHVTGGGTITNFVVLGSNGQAGAALQPVFSEKTVVIQNPLDFDFNTFSLIIDKGSPVAIALQSTGAVGVKLSGTINDLALKRQIADDNPVMLTLNYDLAKLWPIVKPLLSPSSQQTFSDLTISGKQERTITVSGSCPGDLPFGQAVTLLNAGGYLTVDSLSTQGITLSNWDVPFFLSKGILRTVYPDKPDGSNVAAPASCNGGTLDLGVITVDLRTDPMLAYVSGATAAGPHYLLKNVSINPAVSKSILGKILNNPAFVGANDAQGLLSIWVQYADRLPLSDLILQGSPQNKSAAELQYSVTGLQLGSTLLSAFGNQSVSADINNADVKLLAGRVTEDTTLMIDGNKPLRFAGVVVLSTKQFAPMTVYIPPELFSRALPANVRQFVSGPVVVPLKGDMNNPKLDLGQAIAQTIKQGGQQQIINGLLNGLQRIH
jgi:hypothetical protein